MNSRKNLQQPDFLTIDQMVKDRIINGLRLFQPPGRCHFPYIQSLRCGLQKTLLKTPAKGLNCCHQQCIQLETLLQYIRTEKRWECPICVIAMPYSQIFIDVKLKQLLSSVKRKYPGQSINRIQVFWDNSWKLVDQELKTTSESTVQNCFSISYGVLRPDLQKGVITNDHFQPSPFFGFRRGSGEVEWFDPWTHQWVIIPDIINQVTTVNYKISYTEIGAYILGGTNHQFKTENKVFRIDLQEGLVAVEPMITPRTSFAVCYNEGDIYVFGGINEGEILALSEKYEVQKNLWSDIMEMPEPRYEHVAVVVNRMSVMIMAGELSDPGLIWKFNTLTNTWMDFSVKLPKPVNLPFVFFSQNQNSVVLLGGAQRQKSRKLKPSHYVQILDLRLEQWNSQERKLPINIAEAPYDCIWERGDKLHLITAAEEGFHIVYDLPEEIRRRPPVIQLLQPQGVQTPRDDEELEFTH